MNKLLFLMFAISMMMSLLTGVMCFFNYYEDSEIMEISCYDHHNNEIKDAICYGKSLNSGTQKSLDYFLLSVGITGMLLVSVISVSKKSEDERG